MTEEQIQKMQLAKSNILKGEENNELREIADRIQSEYNELLNKKRINSEYRPCIVRNKKALFHKWVHTKDLLGQEFEVGLVEYENGQIGETTPNSIKFCDAKLDEYCFTKEE